MSTDLLADDAHVSSLERMLRGLELPLAAERITATSQNWTPAHVAGLAPTLVTPELARRVWLDWHAEQSTIDDPSFLDAVTRLLRHCVSMGFSLGRLKKPMTRLVATTRQRVDWMTCLEDAVAECSLRVSLDPQSHGTWFTSSSSAFDKVFENVFSQLGLAIPPPQVSVDPSLNYPSFRIEWNDFHLPAWRGLRHDRVLVNDTVDRLTLLSVKGEVATDPMDGRECATIPSDMASIAEQAGLTVWNPPAYITRTLERVVTANAGAFVNRSLVDLLLFQLEQVAPDTVSHAKNTLARDLVVQVLRGLLCEEISIKNLSPILEQMLIFNETVEVDSSKHILFEANPGAIYAGEPSLANLAPQPFVDMVRTSLKRYISHKYSRGGSTLVVYLLDPQIEARMARREPLTDTERAELLRAVNQEVGNLPPTAQNPVILTVMEIRRRVREEVQLHH